MHATEYRGSKRESLMVFFSYPYFIGWLSGVLQRNSSNTTGRRNLFLVVICGLYSPCICTYMCLVVLCNYEVYVLNHCFPLSITFISHT
ncbi:hypothetical protein V8C43DRAFT_43658 [Trichoderma afarasin]